MVKEANVSILVFVDDFCNLVVGLAAFTIAFPVSILVFVDDFCNS